MPPQPDNKSLTPDEVQNEINEKMEDARARLKADGRQQLNLLIQEAIDTDEVTADGILSPQPFYDSVSGVIKATPDGVRSAIIEARREIIQANLQQISGSSEEAAKILSETLVDRDV